MSDIFCFKVHFQLIECFYENLKSTFVNKIRLSIQFRKLGFLVHSNAIMYFYRIEQGWQLSLHENFRKS